MPEKLSQKPMTIFQKRVYEVVKRIPEGKVSTYKEIAQKSGRFRAWRAVGNILNKNTNSKIPCHRVIRSGGKVGGYNKGTKQKVALLKKESVIIKNGRSIS